MAPVYSANLKVFAFQWKMISIQSIYSQMIHSCTLTSKFCVEIKMTGYELFLDRGNEERKLDVESQEIGAKIDFNFYLKSSSLPSEPLNRLSARCSVYTTSTERNHSGTLMTDDVLQAVDLAELQIK